MAGERGLGLPVQGTMDLLVHDNGGGLVGHCKEIMLLSAARDVVRIASRATVGGFPRLDAQAVGRLKSKITSRELP